MLGVTQVRKRPVVVSAVLVSDTNARQVAEWCGGTIGAEVAGADAASLPVVYVDTLEGRMLAHVGDWIIRGTAGEFYPCKPDIFADTYEPLNPEPPGGEDI